jgi:hypothetical protein
VACAEDASVEELDHPKPRRADKVAA